MSNEEETFFPLTREQFAAWLDSKPADEVVGFAMDNCSCPLAKVLSAPHRAITVGDKTYSDEYGSIGFLPKWAQKFVYSIDLFDLGYAVTADEARRILAEI